VNGLDRRSRVSTIRWFTDKDTGSPIEQPTLGSVEVFKHLSEVAGFFQKDRDRGQCITVFTRDWKEILAE